ncbi:AMP-binding protein [Cupriavidus oxalaticus]|uniref:Acyl-CoA synthetase n=1 Tax=Cupriavidus oxalaticus TaxID=96344 RepID=A0A5P3VMC3_9BURK|nr:AMP-binding protein [Cupriavidus oxalaticus]QEZ46573.1 acyl-CoA synthetase [Cupriavidus oxalaticus]
MFSALQTIRSIEDIEALEQTPLHELLKVESTYEIFRNSALGNALGIALRFLPTAEIPCEDERYTYAELLKKIHQTANALHSLGHSHTDTVGILLPGSAEYHFALWGGSAAAIVQPLNPLLSAEKMSSLLNTTRARVLIAWADEEETGIWQKVAQLRTGLTHVLYVSPSGHAPDTSGLSVTCLDFHALISAQEENRLVSGRNIARDDVAAYFHTGGTTGAPKLAAQTHGAQVFSAWATVQMLGLSHSDRTINGYPLFHVAGVYPGSLACFAAGAEVIIPTRGLYRNKAVIANFWKLIDHWRPTVMSAVPTVLTTLAGVPLDGADISSIRLFRTGSSSLSPETAARFKSHTGLHVHESLGMTEMTGISTITPPGVNAPPGHVGMRLPFAKIRICRPDADGKPTGEDAAPGEAGLVLFKSPNLFSGYVGGIDRSTYLTEDGWLITGDIGALRADGLLRLLGRSKDVIIRSGHNIDPQVIEQVLERHPAVKACAAVGAPDPYAGELPVAFVVLEPRAQTHEAELQSFAAAHVDEAPARPRYVKILPELPTTNVGKVYKPQLRSIAKEIYAQQVVEKVASDLDWDNPRRIRVAHTEGRGFLVTCTSREVTPELIAKVRIELAFMGEDLRFGHE